MPALVKVVFEAQSRFGGEKYDGCHVADGHERHCNVGECPYECELRNGAEHDGGCGGYAQCKGDSTVGIDEGEVCLAVVVVGDDGCEGEKYDGDGYE